jgi:LmbE family N-acetylglucosaminyl deacetylase
VNWIYLSPHLDDVALSCGGLVWEQVQAGEHVEIWTVCAGDPPAGPLSPYAESLHARWQAGREAVAQRRAEDLLACRELGAVARHFFNPDCIYRRSQVDGTPLYNSDRELFGATHPAEEYLVEAWSRELQQSAPPGVNLVCPLALGGHVDHRLVRAAAETSGNPLWYYADYPYVLQDHSELEAATAGMPVLKFPVTPAGLQAWEKSVAAHASQVSTFWPDLASMQAAIHAYCRWSGGLRLWQTGK